MRRCATSNRLLITLSWVSPRITICKSWMPAWRRNRAEKNNLRQAGAHFVPQFSKSRMVCRVALTREALQKPGAGKTATLVALPTSWKELQERSASPPQGEAEVKALHHHDDGQEHPKSNGQDEAHHQHAEHHHGHGAHGHAVPENYNGAFLLAIFLNVGFDVLEIFYGFIAQSTALMADAGHNLSDVLCLLLAWGAALLAKKQPDGRYTYGLRSTSILAALVNSMLLLIACGAIAWEAVLRLH